MHHCRQQLRRNRQGGYVLLLTLLLLAIAASAAANVARLSIAKATASNAAGEQLQRRWGTISCRRTFELAAERVLAEVQHTSRKPVSAYRQMIVLGSQQFEVIVTDEQAKVNVNSLLARLERASAEHVVRRLASTSADLRVELTPTPPPPAPAGQGVLAKPTVAAYEQLFTKLSPELLTPDSMVAGAGSDLTCWGDGRVNVHRGSRAALAEACAPLLNLAEVQRLLDLRAEKPDAALGALLDQLALSLEARQAVSSRLTDRSACHGVWVVNRGERRAWYSFSVVADPDESEPQAGGARRWYFKW